MSKIEVNDILCYVTTANNAGIPKEDIVLNAGAYYKKEDIHSAKEKIYALTSTIPPRRQGVNKEKSDINDIVSLIISNEKVKFPTFVAKGYNSMPPQKDFSAIANYLVGLTNSIADLVNEVDQLKQSNTMLMNYHSDAMDSKQDLADIKLMIKSVNDKMQVPIAIPEVNVVSTHSIAPTRDNSSGNARKKEEKTRSPFYNHRNLDDERAYTRSNIKNTSKFASGNRSVVGTAEDMELTAAAERIKTYDLIIGNCSVNASVDLIKKICLGKMKVTLLDCVEFPTRQLDSKYFKITMKTTDRDLLMTSDMWPKGVIIKKYYNKVKYNVQRRL